MASHTPGSHQPWPRIDTESGQQELERLLIHDTDAVSTRTLIAYLGLRQTHETARYGFVNDWVESFYQRTLQTSREIPAQQIDRKLKRQIMKDKVNEVLPTLGPRLWADDNREHLLQAGDHPCYGEDLYWSNGNHRAQIAFIYRCLLFKMSTDDPQDAPVADAASDHVFNVGETRLHERGPSAARSQSTMQCWDSAPEEPSVSGPEYTPETPPRMLQGSKRSWRAQSHQDEEDSKIRSPVITRQGLTNDSVIAEDFTTIKKSCAMKSGCYISQELANAVKTAAGRVKLLDNWGPEVWGLEDRNHLLAPVPGSRYPIDLYWDVSEHRELIRDWVHAWIIHDAAALLRNHRRSTKNSSMFGRISNATFAMSSTPSIRKRRRRNINQTSDVLPASWNGKPVSQNLSRAMGLEVQTPADAHHDARDEDSDQELEPDEQTHSDVESNAHVQTWERALRQGQEIPDREHDTYTESKGSSRQTHNGRTRYFDRVTVTPAHAISGHSQNLSKRLFNFLRVQPSGDSKPEEALHFLRQLELTYQADAPKLEFVFEAEWEDISAAYTAWSVGVRAWVEFQEETGYTGTRSGLDELWSSASDLNIGSMLDLQQKVTLLGETLEEGIGRQDRATLHACGPGVDSTGRSERWKGLGTTRGATALQRVV
ncbi:hypothetical protein P171DRAFT_527023 [Karstenula rhodostoma CBS 690.94]|uniref:Uncharacterized protein n=1 Tax=Karstenula rhodostoma CBS 690.94 TaxID=1392251 RepID=A0A9P4P6J6_9PLEO|nr:hypothetical protein P171DRAFT_527023 [Karstenula rhodostoma CBS 690.94]